MAYTEPYIDYGGIHVPSYTDIRDDLIEKMKAIFGSDIYIDEDSQDYQQISIMAKKIYDTNAMGVLAYNNRTPNTAIGVGLDVICALAGITRKPATYSIVQVSITGDPNTVITNGKVSDGTYNWILPDEVTIPSNGIITVEARSEKPGAITASANSITTILTPVFGWFSVTNNYIASPGVNEESDAELRARFALSTQLPAQTVLDGITAGIESVPEVTRVKGYENDTDEVSEEGFPPHSITYVVEGGTDKEIATEIFFRKTPGCYTNGTTSYTLTSAAGSTTTIRFYRPTYKTVYVKVNITKLTGYSDNSADLIKQAVKDYIDTLEISDSVYRSILWSVAISQMGDITNPTFTVTGIQTSTDGKTFSDADVTCLFNEAATTEVKNITVVVS